MPSWPGIALCPAATFGPMVSSFQNFKPAFSTCRAFLTVLDHLAGLAIDHPPLEPVGGILVDHVEAGWQRRESFSDPFQPARAAITIFPYLRLVRKLTELPNSFRTFPDKSNSQPRAVFGSTGHKARR